MASVATPEDEARRQNTYNSFIFLISAATAVVALRLFVKWKYIRNVGPEDYFSVVSLAFAAGMTALMFREIHYATNGELDRAIDDRRIEGYKALYGSLIFYYLSLLFTKLSFLLQYLRIFVERKMRIAVWTVLGIVVIYGGWTFFGTVFFCTPLDSFWNNSKREWCFNIVQIWIINGCLNIFTDLLIITLPLPGLKGLMLPLSRKLGLMIVFALGGFVCVASTLRVVAIALAPDGEFRSWGNQPLALWTAIETNVAIICSCLPTLRTLAARLWLTLRRWAGTRSSSQFSIGRYGKNHSNRTQDKDIFVTTTHTIQESPREFEISQISLPTFPFQARQAIQQV